MSKADQMATTTPGLRTIARWRQSVPEVPDVVTL